MQLGFSLFLIAISTLVVWSALRVVLRPGRHAAPNVRAPLKFVDATAVDQRDPSLLRAA